MKPTLLLPLVFLCSTALAQPILTWENYIYNIASGTETYLATDAEGEVFRVGLQGSTNNTYDLSGFTYDPAATGADFLAPEDTPFYYAFPDATHATKSFTEYGPQYNYSRYDNGTFYNIGTAISVSGTDLVVDLEPDQVSVTFPLKLGDAWDYQSNTLELLPGLTQRIGTHSEVIAAGSLVTPVGTYDCLVMRIDGVIEQSMTSGGTTQSIVQQTVTLNMLTNAGVYGIVSLDTLTADTDEPLIVAVGYTKPILVDATEKPETVAAFSLSPAYPNPVSAGTDAVLTWSNEARLAVRVSVFDALGREAALLYEGVAAPGTHTHTLRTSTLRPGMYFVRMQSGATVRTTPFVVQR